MLAELASDVGKVVELVALELLAVETRVVANVGESATSRESVEDAAEALVHPANRT